MPGHRASSAEPLALQEGADSALDALDFSGVAVVDGPAGRLAEVARGLADRASGRPNTLATRFAVASGSKLVTAIAVLRLAAAQRLDLDRPLVDWLAPARRPTSLHPAVTVRHLLTHTSGIADYFDEDGDEPYEAIWERIPSARMRTPEDMLTLFCDLPPRTEPGAEVRYNNAAFVLLALAVEHASALPFPDAIAKEVFEPARMTRSGYPAVDDVEPDLAIGYLPPDERDARWRSNVVSVPAVGGGDGGGVHDADDLMRMLRALRDGELVPEPLLSETLAPAVSDEAEGWSYGLGLILAWEGRRRWIGHTGEDPGVSARIGWYPAIDVQVVILSNVSSAAGPAARAIDALLFD
jgi:CubicO group peptidase (beta-lactamase class C family)